MLGRPQRTPNMEINLTVTSLRIRQAAFTVSNETEITSFPSSIAVHSDEGRFFGLAGVQYVPQSSAESHFLATSPPHPKL
eukprot:m.128776 g.128776  ORF g.128776 m.128776 type:complete len:80 (+) comp37956_c0_seq3:91-330(+)